MNASGNRGIHLVGDYSEYMNRNRGYSSLNRNARRNPSSRKFFYRRILALAIVAVLVWLAWTAVAAIGSFVSGLFGGETQTTQSADGNVAACDPAKLELVPLVLDDSGNSSSSFAIGINPFFAYSITNTGEVDCTFDLGPKETYFTVSSGSEKIWYSGDCQGRDSLTGLPMTLKAGETKKSAANDWYRVRSSSSGCGAEQNPVTAAGASYHLSVSVNGLTSKATQQFVLN